MNGEREGEKLEHGMEIGVCGRDSEREHSEEEEGTEGQLGDVMKISLCP